jgi:RNA binding exosome subunit
MNKIILRGMERKMEAKELIEKLREVYSFNNEKTNKIKEIISDSCEFYIKVYKIL